MRAIIKDFSGHMDGVGYNDDFGDIINSACLIDTTSDSKKFSFSTCYERSVVNSFDERLIGRVNVRNGCSNIVLDAGIGDHKGRVRNRREVENYIVKFLSMRLVGIFIIFIN